MDVRPLAGKAVAAAEKGALKFSPDVWKNTWYSWLRSVRPWNISRQLYWGHRIPAYYDANGALAYVGDDPPEGLAQDTDVLDTWFSSGLWPMATLGWPDEDAPDFKRFYPNDILVTGFDIIFFWVARMVFFAGHFTGKLPFKTVVMHGLVTDEHGAKMSKTKGNVINPIEIIDEFGIDAVRFAICAAANENRTNPFKRENCENARRFLTKLLNAVAFWEGKSPAEAAETPLADWILGRMNETIADLERAMDNYRYDEYAGAVYHFVWDDFCSTFIELAKKEMTARVIATARTVLENILRMLQPVAPFISAEIAGRLGFAVAEDFLRAPFAAPVPAADASAWMDSLRLAEDKKDALRELPEVERRIASLEAQLANKSFAERARPEVVAERRASLEQAVARRDALKKLV
jgi:valyl-tRNA synthetase